MSSKSNFWKVILEIKNKLTKTQLKKFEKSCFGHFLRVSEIQFSGQVVNQMLFRQCVCDDEEVTEFNFGGSGARLTCKEFGLITGLWCGRPHERKVAYSTHISDRYFEGKQKVTNSKILQVFRDADCNDDNENDNDRLKLALFLFLEVVLLGKESMATASHEHMQMVDDLDYFNSYPWGTTSYKATMRSMHSAFHHRGSRPANKSKTYSLCGFPLAFLVSYLFTF